MSLPAIIMWACVLAVGLLFFVGKSPTAGALVMAWLGVEFLAPNAGYSIYADIFVLAVILTNKERSQTDMFIAALFLVAWATYAAPMHEYHRYWLLWWLTLAQFFAAGWDAFSSYSRAEPAGHAPENNGQNSLLVAYGRIGGFG